MKLKHVVYTPDLFTRAFEESRSDMERLMEEHAGVKGYLVALPPLVPEPKYMDPENLARLVDESGFRHDFGGCSEEHPYDKVAPAKLLSVYVWQRPSREVRDQHLVMEGMSRWAGGIGGLHLANASHILVSRMPLIAYSGQPEDVDEEIAWIYHRALLALADEFDYSQDPSAYPIRGGDLPLIERLPA